MADPGGHDHRAHDRRDAGFACTLSIGSVSVPCRARDISAGGVRLALAVPPGLPKGVTVTLDIEGFGEFDADVVWIGAEEIGLRFDADPMTMVDVLEAMALHG
jgi:hypothetical protein